MDAPVPETLRWGLLAPTISSKLFFGFKFIDKLELEVIYAFLALQAFNTLLRTIAHDKLFKLNHWVLHVALSLRPASPHGVNLLIILHMILTALCAIARYTIRHDSLLSVITVLLERC